MTLTPEKVWTYEDYLQLPEDGNRYEVIGGKLYMTPAPLTKHQLVSRRLQFLFYELERQGCGFVYNAPTDLMMPGCTPVEPDLIFLTADQAHLIKERYIEGVPAMVIEILSPSTAGRDRTVKSRTYARCGVPHYWVVDPAAETLEAFGLQEGSYRLLAAVGRGESYEPTDFPGVRVEVDELFRPILPE